MVTRRPTPAAMKTKLRNAFQLYLGINSISAGELLAKATLQDKAYELSALIAVMSELKTIKPCLSFTLVCGTSVVFRAKGGPIDRNVWPYIKIFDGRSVIGEIWVDIECTAISAQCMAPLTSGHQYGRCHELDIVVVRPGTVGRPQPDEVFLAVEAKNRPYNKALLKELLGVRREMTMKQAYPVYLRPWLVWWDTGLFANPPSGLVAFCSSSTITRYTDPADFWGIHMKHLPI